MNIQIIQHKDNSLIRFERNFYLLSKGLKVLVKHNFTVSMNDMVENATKTQTGLQYRLWIFADRAKNATTRTSMVRHCMVDRVSRIGPISRWERPTANAAFVEVDYGQTMLSIAFQTPNEFLLCLELLFRRSLIIQSLFWHSKTITTLSQ